MKKFLYHLYTYKILIVSIVAVCFFCSFLRLQNFDPAHPTLVNNTCIQALPGCASTREALSALFTLLLFMAGIAVVYVANTSHQRLLRMYISDVLYVPILNEPLRVALRRGILHAKDH
jgi:hypothetical protein